MKIESAELMEKPPEAEELAKKDDKGLPHQGSVAEMSMGTNFQLGRSIQSGYHLSKADSIIVREPVIPDPAKLKGALPEFKEKEVPNPYCIKSVEQVSSSFPVPKPKNAKERKALEEAKKLAAEEAEAAKLIPKYESSEVALSKAEGW